MERIIYSLGIDHGRRSGYALLAMDSEGMIEIKGIGTWNSETVIFPGSTLPDGVKMNEICVAYEHVHYQRELSYSIKVVKGISEMEGRVEGVLRAAGVRHFRKFERKEIAQILNIKGGANYSKQEVKKYIERMFARAEFKYKINIKKEEILRNEHIVDAMIVALANIKKSWRKPRVQRESGLT